MPVLELLRRDGPGVVTLEGVPIRQWYEAERVMPIKHTYHGNDHGKLGLCLLATLAYARLGRDGVALERNLEGRSSTHTRELLVALARYDAYPEASYALEAGWYGSPLTRAAFDGMGLAAHWDLGRDAWTAVNPLAPEPGMNRLIRLHELDLMDLYSPFDTEAFRRQMVTSPS